MTLSGPNSAGAVIVIMLGLLAVTFLVMALWPRP